MKSGAEVFVAGVSCGAVALGLATRALFLGGIFSVFFFDTRDTLLLFAVGFFAGFPAGTLLVFAIEVDI